MLEENKHIYEQVANAVIPDWKKRDKNDLIRDACNCTNPYEKDAYVSAIMLRYWNKLDSYYYKCKLVVSPEDVHGWLVTAVMYALDRQPWNDPKMGIYQDVNGPDKVINRVVESKRLTFYQQLNRYKRKINSAILSLDTLAEDFKDMVSPTYNDEYIFELHELVINNFKLKEYLAAFIIDAILYADVVTDNLDYRRLMSHLRSLDDDFCIMFSDRYELNLDEVREAITYVVKLSSNVMKRKIEYNVIKLRDLLKRE